MGDLSTNQTIVIIAAFIVFGFILHTMIKELKNW